jgi:spore germination protein
LHALGKRIAVEVSAKYQHTTTGRSGLYDYAALGRVADRVFVMNWGWYWSTSEPGPPDDIELSRKVADYVASMPNPTRFVLGTNLYGMDWPNGGGPSNKATALEYADVQALIVRYGATPVLDPQADSWTFTYTDGGGTQHEVWYPDAATVARRVRLARNRGLGIGFWRLGAEDQNVWSDPLLAPGTSWP